MPPLRSKKSKQSRARIKRIMQLDEEVGKLASATPVMISKSLECFLQQLIDETCKETRSRGSKKMTAYHLKHMINASETFDFLREIVEPIPDPILTEPKAGPSKPRKVSGPGLASGSTMNESQNIAPKKRIKRNNQDELQPNGNAQEGFSYSQVQAGNGYSNGEQQNNYSQYGTTPITNNLPNIGTWKSDFSGTGGTGENGRGLYDDYEEDEDDY
ncbi:uncharacterized protein I206_105680 [Kwoniella pini CBS 10737]|uniref:Transcription factor CBF/NF-Y/archaeal histone domain-containing protein n=1 Tax=Kwoniella pini CBS 10737 TaxID=1296096 RepID=A0AAJ8MSG0_9TREE